MISWLATRARLTEGQLYSSVITLVVAGLLLTGLGNVHGVLSTSLAQQPLELPPAVGSTLPPVVVPAAPQPAPEPAPAALPVFPGLPLPEPAPTDPGTPLPEPVPVPSERPTPAPSPSPPAEACDAQPAVDAVEAALLAVDGLTGGALPEEDVLAALGVVTGCDPADPAVIAVGLLIGLGQALPDPGLPQLPPLPFVEVPAPVVTALQPARPAIDAVCGLVGTGQTVASLFISAYPQPVPQLTSQVLFTALSTCGQVRP